MTAAVWAIKNPVDIPSNYYCGWEFNLNPESLYVLMIKRDVRPKEVLEVEVISDKFTTRVYDWQLRNDDSFYQYQIENKSKIKIHSRLINDAEATFVV